MATVAHRDSFGSAVRARREAQHVSLRRFARRASLPATTLSEIERGTVTPNWVSVWRIAGALGTTVGELIETIEEEVPTR